MANSFVPMKSKPSFDDPYIYLYNNGNNGGLSWCINGKPTDSTCNVLGNCVGWACARFNHIYNLITGYEGIRFPRLCCNAENFIEVAKTHYGLKVGFIPKPGAIMVWQRGATLSGNDGAGHVAIVEEVYSNNELLTSESGYGTFIFKNRRRSNSNNNWGSGSAYKFRGFIYNPAVNDDSGVKLPDTVEPDTTKDQVEVLIDTLRVRTSPNTKAGIIGYAKVGYYNYTDTVVANGYRWYKIGNNAWIAAVGGCINIYPKTTFIPDPPPIEDNKTGNIRVTITDNKKKTVKHFKNVKVSDALVSIANELKKNNF